MATVRTVIQPRAEPLGVHLRPTELWRTLWQNRHLVAELGRRQVAARHRGSYLGLLWTVVQPLLLLAVYTLVFTVLMPVSVPEGRYAFVLRLFCGLVVYSVFSDTVLRAPVAVVGNPSYVKKVVFPLEVLPAADLWANGLVLLLNLSVLLLVAGSVHWTIVLFPLVLPPLLLVTLGCAWLVASLGVYVRDVAVSIGVLMTALFFLTPIVYRLDDVPPQWRFLMELNPLAVLVDAARATLLEGHAPHWRALAVAWAVALVVAQSGFAWFRATRRGFADVL
jgi:homopolymeric O-antigen transport system permease protein